MPSAPRIAISSDQQAVRVPRKRIAQLARLISLQEKQLAELDVAFLDEPTIERYNRQFLDHAGPTDVISFDVTGPDDDGLAVQLLICGPVARKQAAQHGQPIVREICRYIAHGLLHQMGYDDQDPVSARQMHAREDDLLDQLPPACKTKGTK